jgi:hypothetical protein
MADLNYALNVYCLVGMASGNAGHERGHGGMFTNCRDQLKPHLRVSLGQTVNDLGQVFAGMSTNA